MNDLSPLSPFTCDAVQWPRRYQRIDLGLTAGARAGNWITGGLPFSAADRCRTAFVSLSAALDLDLREGDGVSSEEFLRLWTDDTRPPPDRPREVRARLSTAFWMRALQGAVVANGSALVAVAFMTLSAETNSWSSLKAAAIVLGLGLLSAAISTLVVSMNSRRRRTGIAPSSWVAIASGGLSYTAFALATLSLILVTP